MTMVKGYNDGIPKNWVSDEHSLTLDMLSHSGPLGLVHHLLNVELLPFGCISTEDCELM